MKSGAWGQALQPLHVTFQDGGARKFKSEKSHSENLDLWTYKTKDSFYCYASDISCVQRAFWAQLVETVEVPFNLTAIIRANLSSQSIVVKVHAPAIFFVIPLIYHSKQDGGMYILP